ncbi:MAG TPA: outer membrane beta-barrel protein [Patescibacteria group bacterium]|nr:outer membrane beta-barrel protein [Patescibacteria group bacterium]
MRKLAFVVAVILCSAMTAAAQEHNSTEVFLGYSYMRANPSTSSIDSFNLNGGNGSIAYYPLHWLGLTADFGGYHVGQVGSTNVDETLSTYLFGPRVRLPGTSHLKPFAQVLVGLAHTTGSTGFAGAGTNNAFGMAVGGGLDVPATRHFGIRLVEVDYLPTWFRENPGGDRLVQNNFRVSTGVRFRF